MRFEEENGRGDHTTIEDARVEAALKHFRASVHAWSEEEFCKARTVRRSRWSLMMRTVASPAMSWGLVAVLAVAGVGVPMEVHHQRQVEAARIMAIEQQKKHDAEEAARLAAINDDELLSHVDSDVAQEAPDAMQPLASLMSDTSSQ